MAKRFLSNINVNDSYTLPSADGTNGQVIQTDGSGNLSFVDFASNEARKIIFTVKNIHGSTLAKGTPVHAAPSATPPSGNIIEVIAADANVAANMPAIGVLNEAILNEGEGECVMIGSVSGIDTSSFNIGDELYVSTTAGAFTNTKPTGTTELVQKIAIVIKSHASNGLIEVFGAGRTNDVPNQVNRDIQFSNDNKLSFGNDNDLRIYHADGGDSIITKPSGGEGDLIIQNAVADKDVILKGADGAGSTTAYIRIDASLGYTKIHKEMRFLDDVELKLGFSGDMRIYHDENNSYVRDVGNGNLYLDTNGSFIGLISDGSFSNGKMGLFYKDGAVELYYDNSKKFETTSSGINVTGIIEATGYFSVEGTSGNTGTASDRWIGGDGTTGTWYYNVPTGSSHLFGINNSNVLTLNGTGGTFAGNVSADTLTLTSGNDDLTFTQSGDDWTINNEQQNNGITIYDGTAGVGINYNNSEYFKVNTSGVYVSNNINFFVDTDTLYVDSTNERVGINSTGLTDYELYVNGKIGVSSYVVAGLGSGGVGLTHNDGEGNANITFNHVSGIPEQNGNSFRIRANTDSSTNAIMRFEIAEGVTADGSVVNTTEVFRLEPDGPKVRATGGGILSLQRDDASIVNGNPIGRLRFSGDDPVNDTFNMGAEIRGQASGTWSTDNYPTELQFYTTTTNALGLALKLDSSQDATFAGDVNIESATPSLKLTDSDGGYAEFSANNTDLVIKVDPDNTVASSTIQFEIDGSEYMRIATGGNIGVGTVSPSAKLHLYVDSANDDTFHIFNGSVRTHLLGSESSNGVIYMRNSSNSNVIRLNTSGDSYFNGGNVGIGTTSPSAKLMIETGSDEGIRIYRTGTNANFGAIEFRNSDDSATNSRIGFNANEMRLEATNQFRFVTNSSDRMFINSSGNVGIGTTSPGYTLDIKRPTNNNNATIFNIQGAWANTSANKNIGSIYFSAKDEDVSSGAYKVAASIETRTPNTWTSTADANGEMLFKILDGDVLRNVLVLDENQTATFSKNVTLSDGSLTITQSVGTETFKVTTPYDRVGKFVSSDANAFLAIQDSNSTDNGVGIDVAGDQLKLKTADSTGLTVESDQEIRFNAYGSGTFTGTSAYNLAVDSSGNIIETSGSIIDGSGTANYLTMWTDSDTIGNGPASYSSGNALTTFSSDLKITNSTPYLYLYDNGNGGGGGAEAQIIFQNTAGNAMGIGYTNDETGNSDLIISTDAGSTHGGYLGLDAAAIVDTQANIILDPKSSVYITKSLGIGTTSPSGKLEVIIANGFSRFWSDNASAYHFVSIGRNASDLELGSAAAANQFFTGTAAGEAVIKAPSSKLHLGHSSGAPAITIDTSNQVGIGTTSPLGILHLNVDSDHSIMRITAGDSSIAGIDFGKTSDIDDARIRYYNSSRHMEFFVANGERMRIDSSGNAGIGTTSPGSRRLNVYTNISGNDVGFESTIARTSGSNYSVRGLANGSGATQNIGGFFNATGATTNTALWAYEGEVLLATQNANDYVGIGTDSPDYKLDVSGAIGLSGRLHIDTDGDEYKIGADDYTTDQVSGVMIRPADNANPTAGDALFIVRSGGGSARLFVEHSGTTGTTNSTFTVGASSTRANGNVVLSSNSDSYFNGGNLGVGTTSPNYKLEVSGSIGGNSNIYAVSTYAVVLDSNSGSGPQITFGSTSDFDQYGRIAQHSSKFQFITQSRNFEWLNNTTSLMTLQTGGDLGIGTTSNGSRFHVHQSTNLGGTAGDTLLLRSLSNTGGSGGNNLYVQEWAKRDAAGTNWTTWRYHNAIYVDGSYQTPGVNTRTFWERDPYAARQYFGSAANYTLTIDGATDRIGIGTTAPTRTLSVVKNTTITSGFNDISEFLDGSIGVGGSVSLNVGRANTTKNLGKMAFKYAGSGSNSNAINWGFYDADNLMTLLASGNVGIGITSPGGKLHVDGNTLIGSSGSGNIYVGGQTSGQYLRLHHNNSSTYIDANGAYVYFRATSGANTRFRFGMSSDAGTFIAAGDVVAYGSPSDKTLKENIKPIENALDKVNKLKGVEFDWKKQDITNLKEDIGFIAQDVQKVLPQLVRKNENGKLSLRHQGIVPVLVEAIKELKQEIETLKTQINN